MTHSRDRSPEGRDSEAGSMRSTRARLAPNPIPNPLIGKGEVVQADEIKRCIDAADRVYPERSHSAENDAFQQGWLAAHNHRLTAQPNGEGEQDPARVNITALPDGRELWLAPPQPVTVQGFKRGYEAGLAEGRREVEQGWLNAAAIPKFGLGDRVTKVKGSSWTGIVVGSYSTSLTPQGYAVESENEPGSVQIYPVTALAPADPCSPTNGGDHG